VASLAERPLSQILEEVASATPAPGGGSSAACTCALAAALVEMAARLGLVRGAGPPPAAPDRARILRERALRLAERELTAYLPVLEAWRLPADHPDRADRLQRALSEAATTPLAIAEAAAETAEVGMQVVRGSNPQVRGDAVTGVLLAEAAATAAAALVEINLEGLGEEDRLEGARDARRRAGEARAEALRLAPN
jgi:methenyltetrahydrofolate cyclohydrolase